MKINGVYGAHNGDCVKKVDRESIPNSGVNGEEDLVGKVVLAQRDGAYYPSTVVAVENRSLATVVCAKTKWSVPVESLLPADKWLIRGRKVCFHVGKKIREGTIVSRVSSSCGEEEFKLRLKDGDIEIFRSDKVLISSDEVERFGGTNWLAVACSTNGISHCTEYHTVKEGRVVQVSRSERLGGRMINATNGLSPAGCLRLCCDTEHCTVAAYEHQGGQNCYLFACGDADDFRCEFVPYSDYEVAVLSVPRRELTHPISAIGRSNMADQLKSFPEVARTDQESSSAGFCGRYEFQCKTSRQCIPIYDRCNGVFECPDRSDEEECGRYQQEKFQSEGQADSAFQGSTSGRLEDELRHHQSDDNSEQQTLWDRGRNRLPAISSTTPDFWKFQPEATPGPQTAYTAPATTAPPSRSSLPASTAVTSPREGAVSITSVVTSSQAGVGENLLTRISNETAGHYPSWLNFSDASHSLVSVLLILAIGFCTGTTLFVIGRCLCKRRPKVTKYRVVDPDAEDFLLSGTFG